MSFNAFEARYKSGDCAECGVWIEEGDMIGYNDEGDLVHEECYEGGEDDEGPKQFVFGAETDHEAIAGPNDQVC